MMAFVALGFTAVSCNDDDDDVTFSTTPEIAAAGTYVGTYSKVLDGDTDTTYAAGTVVITAGEAYQAYVAFDAGDLYSGSSIANIAHANDGFVFENVSTNNGMGIAFSGRIYGDGSIISAFSTSEKVGRNNYTYNYVFTGVKQ